MPSASLFVFSPEATRRTFTPGARALLEEATRAAERAVHVVRGLFLALLLTIVELQGGAPSIVRLVGALAHLNDYFSAVVAPLAAEHAVLDKYIGDGIFAFFEGEGHPSRAMRAARGVLLAVERYNAPPGRTLSR